MNRKAFKLWFKASLWIASVPLKLARLIVRFIGGWILVTNDSLPCPSCGESVSLFGRWECGWCNFVFDGHAFAKCENCGAVPPYIPCHCGVGVRNPTLFR